MGDSNNLTLRVPNPPDGLRKAITEAFEKYAYHSDIYVNDGTENGDIGELMLGANDCWQGSVNDLAGSLDKLIAEGAEIECTRCAGKGEYLDVDQQMLIGPPATITCERCDGAGEVKTEPQDFAYLVHDDPKYEYLGTIWMHVPGLEDFNGECDAEGGVTIHAGTLMDMIDKATDLDELRREVASQAGAEHYKAFG